MKSVVYDPKNGFNAAEALTEKDIQKLEEVSNYMSCNLFKFDMFLYFLLVTHYLSLKVLGFTGTFFFFLRFV